MPCAHVCLRTHTTVGNDGVINMRATAHLPPRGGGVEGAMEGVSQGAGHQLRDDDVWLLLGARAQELRGSVMMREGERGTRAGRNTHTQMVMLLLLLLLMIMCAHVCAIRDDDGAVCGYTCAYSHTGHNHHKHLGVCAMLGLLILRRIAVSVWNTHTLTQ